ncbi:restriction endonuclease subunit S [Caldicellulosiruptoraceae bacterium PP1]
MSKFKRYERYKDSGVEWIGEIPEHWELRKIKHIGMLSAGGVNKKIEEGEELFKSVHYMDVYRNSGKAIGNDDDYLVVSATQSQAKNCTLRKGDVLFTSSSETPDDIGHAVTISEDLEQTLYGYHLIRLRLDRDIPADYSYRKYMFNNHYFRSYFSSRTQGITRYGLKHDDYKEAVVFIPPINEQKIIANFLDQKTAEIDGLITDKEKLIELLQEKRQAIITEAVTKGLNPNVRMKDSGVEWIGSIPEHWQIIPLKHITNFISRGNSPEYVEESSIKVINQACIYWDELKIENVKYQYDDIDFDKLKGKLIKGDLLLNSTGTGTLGRAVVFREDGKYMADSHVTIIRFNKTRMNEVLAFYLLQTKIYQGYIYNALVTGATNQIELSRERLTGTPMIVPPSTEQQEIVNFLNSKIGQIAILINEIKTQIHKLEEYRQSLISEAVTGKIDVRDYVMNN